MGFSRKDESGDRLYSRGKSRNLQLWALKMTLRGAILLWQRDPGSHASMTTEPGAALKLSKAVQSTLSFSCFFYLCPFH